MVVEGPEALPGRRFVVKELVKKDINSDMIPLADLEDAIRRKAGLLPHSQDLILRDAQSGTTMIDTSRLRRALMCT